MILAMLIVAAAPVACRAVDGDTLRCGPERVRLLGIDAPELTGHCRPGRRCAPGDAGASKASMTAMVRRPVTLRRVGRDHYGRTLATAETDEGDLGCRQLAAGRAIYRPDWDQGGIVARRCGMSR